MIIYTIVPPEVIFNQQEGCEQKSQCIAYDGNFLEVTHMNGSKYKINRVISTDLNTYLDPDFQPGSTIEGSEIGIQ